MLSNQRDGNGGGGSSGKEKEANTEEGGEKIAVRMPESREEP